MDAAGNAAAEFAAFRWSKWKVRRMEILSALIGALGIPLLFIGDAGTAVLGGVWIAVFLWCVWLLHSRSRSSEPVVVVDAEGIRDRRIAPDGWRWAEIREIGEFEVEHHRMIGVEFHHPRSALGKTWWLARAVAPLQRVFRMPSVSINLSLLDGSIDEFRLAVQRFQPGLEWRED